MATIERAIDAPRLPFRTFFGQPPALAFLAFTEAWERFSYYGMSTMLVLYMSHALLMPGHVEHVVGFAGFRAALEAVRGHLSPLALASQIYGLYTGFVYFTPVFGGYIADRWIGRRNAVMTGAVLMSGGHIAMAFDQSFLLALLLLIVGCGLLKGNISSQVGHLYAENDGAGRTRGFAIFSMGINVGAVAGPVVCGLLAQIYGWHAGFGLAGVLMLIGLATYISGYRYLRETTRVERETAAAAPMDAKQWRAVAVLGIVIAVTVFQSIAYYQDTNMGMIWIDRSVALAVFGFHIPIQWITATSSLASILAVPLLFAFWRTQAAHGAEPGEIAKIATGAMLAGIANLCLAVASLMSRPVSALFPIAYEAIQGVAFLYYWPTLLALVSRASPHRLKATMMGCVFLSLFVSNTIIGWIGGFYEHMSPASFWAMQAGIAATGGILALLLKRWLDRELNHVPQKV
jgi:POT family proton-dependent oligopeptide transporter